MEIYEKICKLAEKKSLMARDKEYIAKLAAENGVEVNPLCPNCYHDTAVQLAVIYKPNEQAVTDCGYELRDGLDVTLVSSRYGEYRICAATLTAENVKKWLAAGIPLTFFKRVPEC